MGYDERSIDPKNYLDLAGGREDIAADLMRQDIERGWYTPTADSVLAQDSLEHVIKAKREEESS